MGAAERLPFADVAQRPLTLGTAGHIDHGKTTLVKALTGVDTDRLPDEKRRGISIELGYAPLQLPSGRRLSIVDVPGHERLVRTMVAGATGVDMFLTVVAADEGPMPQTYEHLHVLKMLDVKSGLIAITKWDRVAETGQEQPLAKVKSLLERTGYVDIPVLTVSAIGAEGLDDLKAAIDELADKTASIRGRELQRRELEIECRLHIDRVFTVKGSGTVVTGTLWSGSVASGERVRILPSGQRARVRAVQVHDRALDRAVAGQRVALNLAGVSTDEVKRGDVVVMEGGGAEPTYAVEAEIELLRGVQGIRKTTRLRVHHGTRVSPARIKSQAGGVEALGRGERARVRVHLEHPLIAVKGDRLVLRTVAPPATVGGGVIVETAPRQRDGVSGRGGNSDRARVAGRDGQSATPSGAGGGKAGKGKKKLGGPVAVGGRELLAENLALAGRLLRLLAGDGYAPRSPYALSQAAGTSVGQATRLLNALAEEDKLVKVAEGIYYLPRALVKLREEVEAICERNGGEITIAALRDHTGISRKWAQAVLEHLDSQQLTRRVGDVHKLRRSLP